VSFFRLRQALAEMLQCISQTPVPVALSFAIVSKYWPLSADHVWASEVGKRFVSDLQRPGPSSLRRRVPNRSSLRSTWRLIGDKLPTQLPTHECTFGAQIEEVLHENIPSVFKEIAGCP
jgi:hypothetical protein